MFIFVYTCTLYRAYLNAMSAYTPAVRSTMIEDMVRFGYLLPPFIPLHTRHMCFGLNKLQPVSTGQTQVQILNKYIPYDSSCFAKPNTQILTLAGTTPW